MTNYKIKSLTKTQNEMVSEVVEAGEIVIFGNGRNRTAKRLEALGFGKLYCPQGMMKGMMFKVDYPALNSSIKIVSEERMTFGRYIVAELV